MYFSKRYFLMTRSQCVRARYGLRTNPQVTIGKRIDREAACLVQSIADDLENIGRIRNAAKQRGIEYVKRDGIGTLHGP